MRAIAVQSARTMGMPHRDERKPTTAHQLLETIAMEGRGEDQALEERTAGENANLAEASLAMNEGGKDAKFNGNHNPKTKTRLP